jgi:hypothetical protein
MFAVLQRGQNIIHTDTEFRTHYLLQYPLCAAFLTRRPVTSDPKGGFGVVFAADNTSDISNHRYGLDPTAQIASLRADIDAQRQVGTAMQRELAMALQAAENPGTCATTSCDVLVERVIRPVVLRGGIAQSELLQRQLEVALSSMERGERAGEKMILHAESEQLATASAFDRASKEIVMQALREAIETLRPHLASDKSGLLTGHVAEFSRELKSLQIRTPYNDTHLSFLKLPVSGREGHIVFRSGFISWMRKNGFTVGTLALGLLILSVLGWIVRRWMTAA